MSGNFKHFKWVSGRRTFGQKFIYLEHSATHEHAVNYLEHSTIHEHAVNYLEHSTAHEHAVYTLNTQPPMSMLYLLNFTYRIYLVQLLTVIYLCFIFTP
jgi:hypothetical protein